MIVLLQGESLLRQSPVREICPQTDLQMPRSCIIGESPLPKQEGVCMVGVHAWVPPLPFVPSAAGGFHSLVWWILGELGYLVQHPSPFPLLQGLLPASPPSAALCLHRAQCPLTPLCLPACSSQRASGMLSRWISPPPPAEITEYAQPIPFNLGMKGAGKGQTNPRKMLCAL